MHSATRSFKRILCAAQHFFSIAVWLFHRPLLKSLREMEATSFSAVPEVYGMLLKYGRLGERPLPALRYMTVAGGELRHDLAEEIARRIKPASFHVMYGQSEATARLASLQPQQLPVRRGSIGRPISGVELAVMDESNRELAANAVGMLCARGENVMLGYWRDPTATADAISPDGWLRTGDLAHRDDDGYFFLHGRASLLIKIQGHRVHPAEIEGLVEAEFPRRPPWQFQPCAATKPNSFCFLHHATVDQSTSRKLGQPAKKSSLLISSPCTMR